MSQDESSLRELGLSASDVTRALNELLNHVKDGHSDKIPDIMEQIMTASGELIASYDSSEMVRQARILAQSTAELIQAIKGEAETQSDSDLQVGKSGAFCFVVILLESFIRCCNGALVGSLMLYKSKSEDRCLNFFLSFSPLHLGRLNRHFLNASLARASRAAISPALRASAGNMPQPPPPMPNPCPHNSVIRGIHSTRMWQLSSALNPH